MFYFNVHRRRAEKVVAVCDPELIGKVFKKGDEKLDLEVYSLFYAGQKVEEETILDEFKDATSLNLVGKNSIKLAEKAGFAKSKSWKMFAGVPMLQIYVIK